MSGVVAGFRAACSRVAPSAVVHRSATLMRGSVVMDGAVVGADVVVGQGTTIGSLSSLANCVVGANCIIHPGVRIGQDGFGFLLDRHEAGRRHERKPQTRKVLIGDDVEVGANSCIDRGSWRDTVIGNGTKLDNLIQVGHNVVTGDDCIIASLCGLGGSVTLGDRVYVGAMTGILQHTKIGDNVKIAARSGVRTAIPSGKTYGGNPAVPIQEYHRRTIAVRRAATPRRIRRNPSSVIGPRPG